MLWHILKYSSISTFGALQWKKKSNRIGISVNLKSRSDTRRRSSWCCAGERTLDVLAAGHSTNFSNFFVHISTSPSLSLTTTQGVGTALDGSKHEKRKSWFKYRSAALFELHRIFIKTNIFSFFQGNLGTFKSFSIYSFFTCHLFIDILVKTMLISLWN